MPKRSQRLSLVQKLVLQEEQEEARKLGELRRQLQDEEQKCRELIDYQGEYQEALRQGQITDPSRIQVYHAFIARLSQAVEQQQQQLERLNQAVLQQQIQWGSVHARRKNMDQFVTRCQEEEAQVAEKKLQSQLDDAQGRSHFSSE